MNQSIHIQLLWGGVQHHFFMDIQLKIKLFSAVRIATTHMPVKYYLIQFCLFSNFPTNYNSNLCPIRNLPYCYRIAVTNMRREKRKSDLEQITEEKTGGNVGGGEN